MIYSISLYISQVELHSLDSGYRARTRLCTGESLSTNTGCRHVFTSVKLHSLRKELISCLSLQRNRINCHISFTWMQIGTGMGVRRYWYDLFLLLTDYKSIKTYGTLELDDISYECARENVSKNNMESRIYLEKATREGSILFALEGNLESKFVKLYIRTSAPYLFFIILVSSSRCAIRLSTAVLKRWLSLLVRKTWSLMR